MPSRSAQGQDAHNLLVILTITFSLHQGGVSHAKSDYSRTIIQRTPLSPCTRHLRRYFQYCALFTVYHDRIRYRHPTPLRVIIHQSAGGPSKIIPCETQSSTHMHHGSPLFPIFSALSRRLHSHPSATQGHLHMIHPTSVFPIPVLHLLQPF